MAIFAKLFKSPKRLIAVAVAVLAIGIVATRFGGPTAIQVPNGPTPMESAIQWLGSGESIAPDIPKNQVPDYTVVDFDSMSVRHKTKNWRVMAKTARLYNAQNTLHLKDVTTHIYQLDSADSQGITVITSQEAKLLTQSDQIELFGDVRAHLPDQSLVRSEYMRFFSEQRHIEVPLRFVVNGESAEGSEKTLFTSNGFIYSGKNDSILLPSQVVFRYHRRKAPQITEITSDLATIYRKEKVATFSMRSPAKAFVRIRQTDFLMRSRLADVFFGAQKERVHYLKAHDDVYFQEGTDKDRARYGTCGLAEFDAKANVIFLTK